jgi:exonuclease III
MIDHILVSPAIKKNIFNVFIYHGYDEFCGKYDSDHFPVVVDLYI